MATLNHGTKELICKIVYYGPALGGKTTNLRTIHDRLPKEHRSDLTSLATREDRTLFFDLLPVDMGKIGAYTVKVQLYTVPGQVQYNVTRRVVLNGVDGVVMVFDSDPDRADANHLSLVNLEENLASYAVKMGDLPTVFQYNKRDLSGAMDLARMRQELNAEGGFSDFEASALTGFGVMETLQKICSLVFEKLERDFPARERTATATRTGWRAPTRTRPGRDIPVETPPAPPTIPPPPPPRAPTFVLRQVCDLRLRGLSFGLGVVHLTPTGEDPAEAPYAATIEYAPLFGWPRRESTRFWRAENQPEAGGRVVLYETRQPGERQPARLWIRRMENQPDQLYLDTGGGLGKMTLLPEGARVWPPEIVRR